MNTIIFTGAVFLYSEREKEPMFELIEQFLESKNLWFLEDSELNGKWLKPIVSGNPIIKYASQLKNILKFIQDKNDPHFYVEHADIQYRNLKEGTSGSILLDSNRRLIKRVHVYRFKDMWRTCIMRTNY